MQALSLRSEQSFPVLSATHLLPLRAPLHSCCLSRQGLITGLEQGKELLWMKQVIFKNDAFTSSYSSSVIRIIKAETRGDLKSPLNASLAQAHMNVISSYLFDENFHTRKFTLPKGRNPPSQVLLCQAAAANIPHSLVSACSQNPVRFRHSLLLHH